jgi:hypothetical protein
MLRNITHLFRTPSAKELAMREMQEAERDMLQSQSVAEYATAMASYHGNRIVRLKTFLSTAKE